MDIGLRPFRCRFIMKPSHSLESTDVHTLLHISCFEQFLVFMIAFRQSSLFSAFSCCLMFFGEDQAVQISNRT